MVANSSEGWSQCKSSGCEGRSALHYAVHLAPLEVIRFLVEQGGDLNICNKRGESVLVAALLMDKFKAAKLIIDLGADFNQAETKEGKTVLHRIIQQGRWAAALLLIKAGTDLEVCDLSGHTPLFEASKCGGGSAVAQRMINLGAKVNTIDSKGWAPIHYAAINDTSTLTVLIESGEQLNVVTPQGETPLLLIAKEKDSNYRSIRSQLLISAGADLNISDVSRNTAIHYSVMGGAQQENMVFFLTDAGADPSLLNADHLKPEELASEMEIRNTLCDYRVSYEQGLLLKTVPEDFPKTKQTRL